MTPIERMAQTLIRDLEVITTNNSIPVYEFNDLVQDYKGCGFEIALMQPIKNKNESSYLISEGALMSFEHKTRVDLIMLKYHNNKFTIEKINRRTDLL